VANDKEAKGSGGVPAVYEPINYSVTNIDTQLLKDIIRDNLGSDTLGPNDLERITVPPGGVKVWTLNTAQGEINPTEFEGVIIAQKTTRVFWRGAYSGSGTPPDCFSDDGEIGIGNPGGDCETCPYAEFGSKEGGSGRAQACKQNKLLFIVLQGEILPCVLSVPPTSLQEAKKYILRSVSSLKPLYGVTTKFTLEVAQNAEGVKYGKIRFTQGKVLNEEDSAKMKAYADMMGPTLKKVRGDRPTTTFEDDGVNVIDMEPEPIEADIEEGAPADD